MSGIITFLPGKSIRPESNRNNNNSNESIINNNKYNIIFLTLIFIYLFTS